MANIKHLLVVLKELRLYHPMASLLSLMGNCQVRDKYLLLKIMGQVLIYFGLLTFMIQPVEISLHRTLQSDLEQYIGMDISIMGPLIPNRENFLQCGVQICLL